MSSVTIMAVISIANVIMIRGATDAENDSGDGNQNDNGTITLAYNIAFVISIVVVQHQISLVLAAQSSFSKRFQQSPNNG